MTGTDGIFWSATVFDEQKGQEFKIRATGDEIHVYPTSEDFGLGTFARFVEFVQKNVDEHAEVVVPDGGSDTDHPTKTEN